jgi:hypothetical protein
LVDTGKEKIWLHLEGSINVEGLTNDDKVHAVVRTFLMAADEIQFPSRAFVAPVGVEKPCRRSLFNNYWG